MLKNVHLWLPQYIAQTLALRKKAPAPRHILFCFVDHFEPDWNEADIGLQRKRIDTWMEQYPAVADRHKDADGKYPQHTFFYPAEMYLAEHLDKLSELCRAGFGETEIHLHHDGDTAVTLKEKLIRAREDFLRHGLIGKDRGTGDPAYAFIHGNWALNNSRPDGCWCGVDNESGVLAETGCYADFTYPSAPSDTQPVTINRIYYDVHQGRKSHDTGQEVAAGQAVNGKLMLIQGPLCLNWKNRKGGLIPRIENSDVTGNNPPGKDRVDLWVSRNICVKGREEWIFVKVHTHGAVERNSGALLGRPMDGMLTYLEEKYNDGREHILHYVTAREMYNIAKAAEAGLSGDPNEYRDYLIVNNF